MPTAKPLSASAKAAKTCKYGCTDPVTCAYPHTECHHCALARGKADVPRHGDTTKAMTQNWAATHPIG